MRFQYHVMPKYSDNMGKGIRRCKLKFRQIIPWGLQYHPQYYICSTPSEFHMSAKLQ